MHPGGRRAIKILEREICNALDCIHYNTERKERKISIAYIRTFERLNNYM